MFKKSSDVNMKSEDFMIILRLTVRTVCFYHDTLLYAIQGSFVLTPQAPILRVSEVTSLTVTDTAPRWGAQERCQTSFHASSNVPDSINTEVFQSQYLPDLQKQIIKGRL